MDKEENMVEEQYGRLMQYLETTIEPIDPSAITPTKEKIPEPIWVDVPEDFYGEEQIIETQRKALDAIRAAYSGNPIIITTKVEIK